MRIRALRGMILLLTAASLQAQEQKPLRFRILAYGGLLGHVDGFMELPAGAHDPHQDLKLHAAGGIQGILDWLNTREGIRLVEGNNFGPNFVVKDSRKEPSFPDCQADAFWTRFGRASPAAVALGSEDFVRALGSGETMASKLQAWLQECGPKFVSSNAVLREYRKGMNRTRVQGFELLVDANKAVDWLDKLEVRVPVVPKVGVYFLLKDLGDATGRPPPLKRRAAFFGPGLRKLIPWDSVKGLQSIGSILKELQDETAASQAATYECGAKNPVTFKDSAQHRVEQKAKAGGCQWEAKGIDHRGWKATITLDAPLRPGHRYQLTAQVDTQESVFEFTVVRALTPHDDGLPVVPVPPRHGPPLVVFSAVDPAVQQSLPSSDWEWTEKDTRWAIEFLPPKKAIGQLIKMLADDPMEGPGKAGVPLHVFLSELSDEQNLEVLEAFPSLRVVILPAEARLLGRAVHPVSPKFSGDLGYSAIWNQRIPSLTALVARPEWIGETIQQLEGEWDASGVLREAAVETQFILGKELCWRAGNNQGIVYQIREGRGLQDITQSYDLFPAYPSNEKLDTQGKFDQGAFWADRVDFLTVVLQLLRMKGAEIAILPAGTVDEETLNWLGRAKRVDWLSAFVLQRVLFRSERVVKVSVEGKDLGKVLSSIVKKSAEEEDGVCILGLGNVGCPVDTFADEYFEVNGQGVEANHFYTVILTEELARKHDLSVRQKLAPLRLLVQEHLRTVPRNVTPGCVNSSVSSTSQTLEDRTFWGGGVEESSSEGSGPDLLAHPSPLPAPAMATPAPPPPRAFPNRGNFYFSMDALEIAWSHQTVGQPAGSGPGLFARIPIAGEKAEDQLSLGYKAEPETGWMHRHWIARGLGRIEYNKTRTGETVSASPDELRLGVQFLWRALERDSGRLRVVGGYFWETRLRRTEEKFTPTRTIQSIPDPLNPQLTLVTTQTAPDVSLTTAKPLYRFQSYGLEGSATIQKAGFTLKKVALTYDVGINQNTPVSVSVAGTQRTIDEFLMLGAGGLVNDQFQSTPAAFDSATTYSFAYADRKRRRIASDLDLEQAVLKVPRSKEPAKLGFHQEIRGYFGAQESLAPKLTYKLEATLMIPVYRRIQVVPFVNYRSVRVRRFDEPFTVLQSGIRLKLPLFIKCNPGCSWN